MQNPDIKLTEIVKDMAKTLGACNVGITTNETLKDWHFTTNLDYILEGAKSAITFAVPFGEDDLNGNIDKYLSKINHKDLEKQKVRATTLANGIALEISGLINQIGYDAEPVHSNFVYRKESPPEYRVPPLSHKFLAVRGGIGHMGYSGLIITKEYGSSIALASVVTTAKLKATKSLAEIDNYCDKCKLCLTVCLADYMIDEEDVEEVDTDTYIASKKAHPMRCGYVCTGSTGYKGGKWSTWSAARFKIPEDDSELIEIYQKKAIPAQFERNLKNGIEGGFFHPFYPGYKIEYTCSLCQFVCHPQKEVRKERYKKLVNSGVIIEENGKRLAVTTNEADEIFKKMPIEKKKLYTD
jgi:epoxyqueuosine reductase QueG